MPNRVAEKLYAKVLDCARAEYGFRGPTSVLKHYIYFPGYYKAELTRQLLAGKRKVLIVGDAGGRDYHYLKSHGLKPWVLDICQQGVIENMVLGDVTKPLPFRDCHFDGVVISDVLEHVFEDYLALREIRRVLKDDGILVVAGPFLHDAPEHHVRVYTPNTMRRLLEYSGFEPDRLIYRGFLTAWASGRVGMALVRVANLASCLALGRTFFRSINRVLFRINLRSSDHFSFLHRRSKYYSFILSARKAASYRDFRRTNVEVFSNLK